MLAFQIEIDGGKPFIVCQEDWAVLSFHVTAGRGPKATTSGETRYSVGGVAQPDSDDIKHHFRWATHDLTTGSCVKVTIVDASGSDITPERFRYDSTTREIPFTREEKESIATKLLGKETMAKVQYETYLALKERFEPSGRDAGDAGDKS